MFTKIKRALSLALTLSLTLSLCVFAAPSVLAAGESFDDPIIISTESELATLAAQVNGGASKTGVYYRLGADITLGAWTPIGTVDRPFDGNFDGGGYIISDMTISSSSAGCFGLFGRTGANATIKNLTLTGVSIINTHDTNATFLGALVGDNYGEIQNCHATGSITGDTYSVVGGLVGRNDTKMIHGCTADVGVTGYTVGGLAGGNIGPITYSSASGTVNGFGAGGIAGDSTGAYAAIENCYATGAVTGTQYAGGIAGCLNYDAEISDSFSTGTINTSTHRGGVVGIIESDGGTVSDCYWNSTNGSIDAVGNGSSTSGDPCSEMTGTDLAALVDDYNAAMPRPGFDLPDVNGAFLIYTEGQLKLIKDDLGADYKLMNNITLTATNRTPIGTGTPFNGNFDGGGFTIDGLTINLGSTDYVGLFGYVSGSATISNVTLTGVNVTGKDFTGGLVGCVDASGTVTISNCSVTGTVKGGSNVGGLAGSLKNATVSQCSSEATVTGASTTTYIDSVGGFAGSLNGTTVIECYAGGAVSASAAETCHGIGGFVGLAEASSKVVACYATGSVSATSGNGSYQCIGGFAGRNLNSTIAACYSTGKFTPTTAYFSGGFLGQNYGTDASVTECYDDTTLSTNTGNAIGQFEDGASGTGADSVPSWELAEKLDDMNSAANAAGVGLTSPWGSSIGNLPNLTAFPGKTVKQGIDGDGSSTPFKIYTANQLAAITTIGLDKKYVLMNDITLTAASWAPIGTFTGEFDGNDKTITGLTINGSSNNAGLFGTVSGGTIKKLGLVDVAISGDNYVGGIAGQLLSSATIENCYVTGAVSGVNGKVGGVAGEVINSSIERCYSTATVSGIGNVGGVAGYLSSSTISDCYATGAVSGNGASYGGIVGSIYEASISSCYATGAVNGDGTVGGIVGLINESGTVEDCAALNPSVTATGVSGTAGTVVSSFYGGADSDDVTNCVAYNGMTVIGDQTNGGTVGTAVTAAEISGGTHWNTLGMTSGAWDAPATGTLPTLSNIVGTTQGTMPDHIKYTITLNPNGGSCATSTLQTDADGALISLPTATRSGYTFAGWFTAADSGTQVTAPAVFTGNDTIYAQWTQNSSGYTGGGDPYTPPAPSTPSAKEPTIDGGRGWEDITDKAKDLGDGEKITIDMGGTTEVPGDFLDKIAGKDVDVTFDMGNGLSWTVNGQDIPSGSGKLDLGVALGGTTIPASVTNIDGSIGTVQLSLSHDGAFPFRLTLSVTLDKINAGYFANLYYYNEMTKALEFKQAVIVGADGKTEFVFDHASEYAIVVDDVSHAPWSNPFTDVQDSNWFYPDVAFVHQNGLFAGTSDMTFAPQTSMTRGMVVTVLGRLAGIDTTDYSGASFDDVDTAQYFVSGVGDNKFAPDANISRQDLAVILNNYATKMNLTMKQTLQNVVFVDSDDIASYAVDAVGNMVRAGVINGNPDGTFAPKDNVTRAEVAAMLHRFVEAAQ